MKPTHIKAGLPHMVDVTDKNVTARKATVFTEVIHTGRTIKDVKESLVKASLTSTTATKLLPQFIPMTHPIPFTYIGSETQGLESDAFEIYTTVRANWYTGMEVEGYLGSLLYALTFAAHQDRAFYHFIIRRSMLLYKSGGKSGTLKRQIGKVENIMLSGTKTKPFVSIGKLDPLFITNYPQMAEKDNSYPLIITNTNLYCAKGYIEIGPHVMTITYREIDDNGHYLLMIAPRCDRAVIRTGHNITSLLMEE
ncbi:hypothetical protein GM182_05060 [bacterium 3DAC]|nr:hypothetical protein GM182_05060 [bacterium 3DAC]